MLTTNIMATDGIYKLREGVNGLDENGMSVYIPAGDHVKVKGGVIVKGMTGVFAGIVLSIRVPNVGILGPRDRDVLFVNSSNTTSNNNVNMRGARGGRRRSRRRQSKRRGTKRTRRHK